MKYRALEVDNEYGYSTQIIQVKKWYGWVTIYTISDKFAKAKNKIFKLLSELYD